MSLSIKLFCSVMPTNDIPNAMKEKKMEEYVLSQHIIDVVNKKSDDNPFTSINKLIYQELYKEILEGNILPEHKLVESKIASALQISRSPVKLALQELEARGILEKGKGSSLHVKRVTYSECLKVYEARMALEPKVAYIAASRITDEELDELRKLCDTFKTVDRSKDQRSYTKADTEFHQSILRYSKNHFFIDMYNALEFPLACYRHQLNQFAYEDVSSFTGLNMGAYHHTAIYNMLKMRAPLLAEDAMRNDIQRMYGTLSRLTW